MSKLFYNYAVVDKKYPGEPVFWALAGFGFGDAAQLGWTFEFAPDATKTSELVRRNLASKQGLISLAMPMNSIASREPVWAAGVKYAQLLISVETDDSRHRKIGFYELAVRKAGTAADSYRHRIFKGPTRIVLARITGGSYVASPALARD